MDESLVREEAERHAAATVQGDLRTAGSSLTKEAMADAGEVMKVMPKSLESHEIVSVTSAGDAYVATIRYSGEGRDVTVESRWQERDGAPKIVALSVI